jgi:FlaA1/EpsC-like NDP-sugar epimerase
MSISEASQLVLQAGMIGKSGSIMILDMGQPVKIIELAKQLIQLQGLVPNRDINIVEVGMRPGEKLYEELLIAGSPTTTPHPRIFKSHEEHLSWNILETRLSAIERAIELNDQEALKKILQEIVVGYILEPTNQ